MLHVVELFEGFDCLDARHLIVGLVANISQRVNTARLVARAQYLQLLLIIRLHRLAVESISYCVGFETGLNCGLSVVETLPDHGIDANFELSSYLTGFGASLCCELLACWCWDEIDGGHGGRIVAAARFLQ